MKRTLQIILGLMAAAAASKAQDVAPAPAAADASSIILAPKPATSPTAPAAAQGDAYQPASPAIAQDISSGLPGYRPALMAPRVRGSAQDQQADKPKNQIPRLPLEVMQRYVVNGKRIPTFRIRDLYTPAGLIDLSFKEHPGLRIGNFFNLNSGLAYEKIINEQLFAARQDLVDTAHAIMLGGDPSEGEAVQQAIIDESFEAGGGEGGPVGIPRPITRE
jgi:hypothetical protein